MALKQFLSVTLALGACNAHASLWAITTTDFHHIHHYYEGDEDVQTDYGLVSETGVFSGEDRNGDGTVDLSEVSWIQFGESGYANIKDEYGNYVRHEINTFSYGPQGLSISASSFHQYMNFNSNGISQYGIAAPYTADNYTSTATSLITVAPVAVPEVGTAALFALGLAALAFGRRRHTS